MLYKNAVEPTTLEVLEKICLLPQFAAFALGGGTNIALRKGHRLSVDLDFFTNSPFDTAGIYKILITKFKHIELLYEQNQTMMFTINNVKVDFVLYPFKWLHAFESLNETRLIALPDIIPMKLQALSNRFSKKDFWDIAFLLNSYSLSEMLEIFKSKFCEICSNSSSFINFITSFICK